MIKETKQYEQIITINHDSIIKNEVLFQLIRDSITRQIYFIENKCREDKEFLGYFRISYADSEKSPGARDLKIRWSVGDNE